MGWIDWFDCLVAPIFIFVCIVAFGLGIFSLILLGELIWGV